jgi:hypothetical protein
MNVYYSGWGFIQADGANNEIIKRKTLGEYSGYFKLHETTLESFDVVESAKVYEVYYSGELKANSVVMKYFNDFNKVQSWLVISDQEGNSKPITINKGEVLFERLRVGKLKLLDVVDTQDGKAIIPIPEPTTAPPVQDNAPKEKTSKYQQRYDDFKAWLESDNPPITNKTKSQIEKLLQEREKLKQPSEKLWHCGHKEFWAKQDLIQLERGKKSSRNCIT